MIFAAGIGSRLKPFTSEHPKAMARVGDTPMLRRVMDNLVCAGVSEIVVNIHHFAGEIIDYVDRNPGVVPVRISDESELLLDTGGGVRKAMSLLEGDGPVILHNSDILTNLNLAEMYAAHMASGADVTLLCAPRVTSRYLYFDKNSGRLSGWRNERTGECRPVGFVPDNRMDKLAFGGIHVISPSVFPVLERYRDMNVPFSLVPFYVDNMDRLDIRAYVPSADGFVWCDIGTPESLQKANMLAKTL